MRFRIQNIRTGYCEVWANERDGHMDAENGHDERVRAVVS